MAVNWINNVVRPKLQGMWKKNDVPDDLWVKCPESGQLVFHSDLEDNLYVVPNSDYHMRMRAHDRFKMIFDEGAYEVMETIRGIEDPLKFKDQKKYTDRVRDARAKTELEDAVLVGEGRLDGLPIVSAVQDFAFMGGSLGTAAGGAIITGMQRAIDRKSPFILFVASGGARMQEGIFSLMQMPRTTVMVQRMREACLPYIVVLTDPTMGGVTASYAMLGDIQIAEPGALVGFAGPRVIEQTIRETLPKGFQRAEYLLEHGMVDMVVHRHKLRETLSNLAHLLMKRPLVQQSQTLVDEDVVELIEAEPVADAERVEIAGADVDQTNNDKAPAKERRASVRSRAKKAAAAAGKSDGDAASDDKKTD